MPTRATAQPAHAVVPLDTPYFSIDRGSISVSGTLRARDILDKPGPMVVFSGANMGMASATLDELDDFSVNRNAVSPTQPFLILFSVDKASSGAAMPDPFLVANNRPFNVRDQASKRQAAGDIFMSTEVFTRLGPGFLEDGPIPHGSPQNNTMVKNQGDTGGVDMDLEKEIPPEIPTAFIEPSDELDGISEKDATSAFSWGVPASPTFFYSLRNNSPSLATLPGTPSGANVYVDFNPSAPGGEVLYAGASILGLVSGVNGDDIDGLVVFDNGDFVYNPSQDQIMFSLTRNSPTLIALQRSPADVFMRTNGVTTVLASAADLGLAFTDNIDAIEIKTTNNATQSLLNTAIFSVLPGDYDGSGFLGVLDCIQFRNCFSGAGNTYDTNPEVVYTIAVGPGPTFSPPVVTVETGDSVQWVWTGGLHNVVSGVGGDADGAFSSGAPTSTNGFTYTVDFNQAMMNLHPRYQGAYPYFSSPSLPEMTGTIMVKAHPCAVYDLDYDGDVDCADWRTYRAYFASVAEFTCLPLSIPEFIAALLGAPGPAVNMCLADVNEDNLVNGRDIAPFVQAVIP